MQSAKWKREKGERKKSYATANVGRAYLPDNSEIKNVLTTRHCETISFMFKQKVSTEAIFPACASIGRCVRRTLQACHNDIKRNEKRVKPENYKSFRFPFSFSLFTHSHPAMTLAEVLITLGIIGIVAALTIPNLISKSQEQQYNVALKRFYSDISQAMVTMQASDSPYTIPINDTGINESNTMRDNLCGVMSCIKKDTTIKIFGAGIYVGAAENTVYKNYKSSYAVYTDQQNNFGAALLKNGMFIGITHNWEDRNGFQLYVDTNGAKGPNMFGDDLNMFEILKNDSGYYRPIVEGAPGSYEQVSAGFTCQTGQGPNSIHAWPCSYYRLYKPDKMP